MPDPSNTAAVAEAVDETIHWLLEGDPAIRWQVKRDLLDAPADEVDVERA